MAVQLTETSSVCEPAKKTSLLKSVPKPYFQTAAQKQPYEL